MIGSFVTAVKLWVFSKKMASLKIESCLKFMNYMELQPFKYNKYWDKQTETKNRKEQEK